MKQLRNVLSLITAFAVERRDVNSIDPDRNKGVFMFCTTLNGEVNNGGVSVNSFVVSFLSAMDDFTYA